jgi:hypothetical protein
VAELAAFFALFRTALFFVASYRLVGVEQGVPAKYGPESPDGPPLRRDFSTSLSLRGDVNGRQRSSLRPNSLEAAKDFNEQAAGKLARTNGNREIPSVRRETVRRR